MTIDDLCREIAEKTAREGIRWYLTPRGRIRFKRDDLSLCPLAAVFPGDYIVGAYGAGMEGDSIDDVIEAADGGSLAPEARAKLLHATGLA